MRFETKFNLNDLAWYMKNNKPTEVVISAIEIFYVGKNQDHIKYNARNVKNSVSWLDHQNLYENKLFKSKGDLLNSLFHGISLTCKGEKCSAEDGINHSVECIIEHDEQYINKE